MPVQPVPSHTGSPEPVGGGEYKVSQGECVIIIADERGFFWETIWNDAANADLKRARGSPHVLLPGDKLHIPEKRRGTVDCATEQLHRFRRKGIPLQFELEVKENGEALAGKRYVLLIEGRPTEGTIPGDGIIKVPMMPRDRTGELRVTVDGKVRIYPLAFGHLDPPQTEDGAIARLRSLGYGSGGSLDANTEGIRRFQKDNNLTQSGTIDGPTAAKLAEKHGS